MENLELQVKSCCYDKSIKKEMISLTPLLANVFILMPLKTLENQRLYRVIEREHGFQGL